METLTLNDGTIVRNALTFDAVVGLWIHVSSGMSLSEAFTVFSDPDKTKKIVTDITLPHRPNEPITYTGYTNLVMVKKEEDSGEIIIQLQKGAKN